MTYFADLTPYTYGHFTGALNVGWLDPGHPFATEPPSEALLDALFELIAAPVAQTFGGHQCELCPRDPDFETKVVEAQAEAHGSGGGFGNPSIKWPQDARSRSTNSTRHGRSIGVGNGEIRVAGAGGQVYAAPTLIYHYVADHHYKPPAEFVRAVLTA